MLWKPPWKPLQKPPGSPPHPANHGALCPPCLLVAQHPQGGGVARRTGWACSPLWLDFGKSFINIIVSKTLFQYNSILHIAEIVVRSKAPEASPEAFPEAPQKLSGSPRPRIPVSWAALYHSARKGWDCSPLLLNCSKIHKKNYTFQNNLTDLRIPTRLRKCVPLGRFREPPR